jgi:hypothetical protein
VVHADVAGGADAEPARDPLHCRPWPPVRRRLSVRRAALVPPALTALDPTGPRAVSGAAVSFEYIENAGTKPKKSASAGINIPSTGVTEDFEHCSAFFRAGSDEGVGFGRRCGKTSVRWVFKNDGRYTVFWRLSSKPGAGEKSRLECS